MEHMGWRKAGRGSLGDRKLERRRSLGKSHPSIHLLNNDLLSIHYGVNKAEIMPSWKGKQNHLLILPIWRAAGLFLLGFPWFLPAVTTSALARK